DRIRPEASAAQFLRRPAAILRSLAARERSRTGSAPTGHTACARRPPPRLWEGLQPRCGKLAAEAAPTEAGLQPLQLAQGDHRLASVRLWEGLQPRCGRLAAEAAPTEAGLQSLQLARGDHRFDTVAHVERAEDRGQVDLHRALADAQVAGDQLVRLALRK